MREKIIVGEQAKAREVLTSYYKTIKCPNKSTLG